MTETNSAQRPSWTPADLADPHHHPAKAEKVRGMFAAIARSYDLNNRVHSLWLDQVWRRRVVRLAKVRPGDAVLDVGCGTGDLTHAFARSPATRVVGLDFTIEMLDVAGGKRSRLPKAVREKIEYVPGDAQALPFDEGSFDVVSMAFAIRNIERPDIAARECYRVLRPAGRVTILEFIRPRSLVIRWVHDLYCAKIMPATATWLSSDKSGAYRYLPRSVGTFMDPGAMGETLSRAGFGDVAAHVLFPGICACYVGAKSA